MQFARDSHALRHFFTFAYSNTWKKRAYSVLIFNRIALRVYMMVNIHAVRNVKVKDRYTTLRSSLDCKSRSDTLIANFRTLRFFMLHVLFDHAKSIIKNLLYFTYRFISFQYFLSIDLLNSIVIIMIREC